MVACKTAGLLYYPLWLPYPHYLYTVHLYIMLSGSELVLSQASLVTTLF